MGVEHDGFHVEVESSFSAGVAAPRIELRDAQIVDHVPPARPSWALRPRSSTRSCGRRARGALARVLLDHQNCNAFLVDRAGLLEHRDSTRSEASVRPKVRRATTPRAQASARAPSPPSDARHRRTLLPAPLAGDARRKSRKEGVHRLEATLERAVRSGSQAHLQIFCNRQARKDIFALRHVADAALPRDAALGRRPAMDSPASSKRPAFGKMRPKIAFISVDLPAPFGLTTVTISRGASSVDTPPRMSTSVE